MTGLRDRLRARGLRLTPQRELILAAVERLGHATPDEVLDEARASSAAINISTVYRTLDVLERLGLVKHAHLSDRAPTYHSVGDQEHFHLVCRGCHRIVSADVALLGPGLQLIREQHGFAPDLGHLTMHGHCAACADGPEPAR